MRTDGDSAVNAVEKVFLLEIDGYDLETLNDQLALHGLHIREAVPQDYEGGYDSDDDADELDVYVLEKLP